MREKGQKVKVEMKDDDTFMQIGGRCFHACFHFPFPLLFAALASVIPLARSMADNT